MELEALMPDDMSGQRSAGDGRSLSAVMISLSPSLIMIVSDHFTSIFSYKNLFQRHCQLIVSDRPSPSLVSLTTPQFSQYVW
jgi:hypothetical protein